MRDSVRKGMVFIPPPLGLGFLLRVRRKFWEDRRGFEGPVGGRLEEIGAGG